MSWDVFLVRTKRNNENYNEIKDEDYIGFTKKEITDEIISMKNSMNIEVADIKSNSIHIRGNGWTLEVCFYNFMEEPYETVEIQIRGIHEPTDVLSRLKQDLNARIFDMHSGCFWNADTESGFENWKSYSQKVVDTISEKEAYEKTLYFMKQGHVKAQKFLKEYSLSGKDFNAQFEFIEILPEEAEQAATIEQICFPPNEACSERMMKERARKVPELFLVAVDRKKGTIAGFLNGIATDEHSFRDEFFADAGLHNPSGTNVMLLGLDVLPEYRGQGLAREIMFQYLRREKERGRKLVILTCLESKIKMYENMGFHNNGISKSSWGGEQWYEMSCVADDSDTGICPND